MESTRTADAQQECQERWAPAKPTVVFDTFWRFAAERQAVFFRRLERQPPPWTNDAVLRKFRFTNAYRILDRVSQYLVAKVIYSGAQSEEEVFFRTILFKLFNKVETWELLLRELGEISWARYHYRSYDAVLTSAKANGVRIYSPAYIMPSGSGPLRNPHKHRTHLALIEMMMKDRAYARVAEAQSMRETFYILREYPTIGDFLAYQFATDINYSELTDFSEMEFVVPGPGARDGIRKCFADLGGLNEVELIVRVAKNQTDEFRCRNLDFRNLFGRPLQLIDCQNLFCEVDKYARVIHPEIGGRSGRRRIKQLFRMNPTPIDCCFPPKWGL
ncbi:MAG: nucleotide kinase domain-containing protein, partial [Planctomycetota bacterium]